MDPTFEQATSDADAILACLGPLAIFVLHAERLARAGMSMKHGKLSDDDTREMGERWVQQAADVLKLNRERLDIVMQDLGEYFNGGDACSETMEKLTEPVFDILRKRQEGVSLND